MLRSNWRWQTNVRVTVRRSGLIVAQREMHNLITTAGLGLARDAILGTRSFIINDVGLGSGSAAPAVGDAALDSEQLRVEVISRAVIDADTASTTAYVAPGEGNGFTIEELGWFAEDNSLISRVLYSHAKTNLESIQIERLDTFAEA